MKADTSYGKASEVFRLLTLRLEGEQFRVLTGDGASFSVKPTGAERLEGLLSTTQGESVTIRMDSTGGRRTSPSRCMRSGKVIVSLSPFREDIGEPPLPGENAPLRRPGTIRPLSKLPGHSAGNCWEGDAREHARKP
jgi:hypothetical protein